MVVTSTVVTVVPSEVVEALSDVVDAGTAEEVLGAVDGTLVAASLVSAEDCAVLGSLVSAADVAWLVATSVLSLVSAKILKSGDSVCFRDSIIHLFIEESWVTFSGEV